MTLKPANRRRPAATPERLAAFLAALALFALAPLASPRAEERLVAVHAFPEFLVYTRSFLGFVEDANRRGAGVVSIDVRGGPEAIGPFEQAGALRDGVVDMVSIPASYYGAAAPESDAMVASTIAPMEARANGGLALLDAAHRRRLNAVLLAWPDGGVGFHIYTTRRPERRADGTLDLSAFTIRDVPIYHAFFESLGVATASLKTTEVYSALERGVVDAAAFTSIGVRDQKWDRFLKYRVDPRFYRTDLATIVNLDRWRSLSDEARAILETAAVEWEKRSFAARAADREAERAALLAGGMEIVAIEGEARERYLRLAADAAWGRMAARLDRLGEDGAATAARLRALFAPG